MPVAVGWLSWPSVGNDSIVVIVDLVGVQFFQADQLEAGRVLGGVGDLQDESGVSSRFQGFPGTVDHV